MSEIVREKPIIMRCRFERWVQNCSFFECVHDGSRGLGNKRRSFFTRFYAIKWKGKVTNIGVKFTYDYRVNWADCTIDDVPLKLMSKGEGKDITEQMVAEALEERKVKA